MSIYKTSILYEIKLSDGTNKISLMVGSGSPEGVVARNPGSKFFSTSGKEYRKVSGTGNTGWTSIVPVLDGGTGLTSLGSSLQQMRVNAGATALEYFTPASSSELSGTIYGDGTLAAFPTGVSYLILNPTANNTIDLSTGATYIGAAGRVAMIFNPTNYTFQIHGVTISNHFVYVVWTATNTPGFINL